MFTVSHNRRIFSVVFFLYFEYHRPVSMQEEDRRDRQVHLILLIHGLYGSPANLAVIKEEVIRAARSGSRSTNSGPSGDDEDGHGPDQSDVVVLVATSFKGSHTWDGIDVNAHRASIEIDQEIERLRAQGRCVDRLSIMGYSLGGRELHIRFSVPSTGDRAEA
jgi:hypothetical protein